jgi:hypothetical protein
MKYVVSLLFSTLALFGFGECDTCVGVPFSVPVDLSKKGTVYETDFYAPWNIWGSLVEFYIGANYFINSNIKSYSQLTKEQEAISNSIFHGLPQKSEKDIPYFKIKITLTPLGWASDNVTVMSNLNNGWSDRKEKEYTKGQKIEEVVTIPLFGGEKGHAKTLIIADLQRLRNYHVRVESLEDVELPQGVSTEFYINRFSAKH